MSCSIEYAGVQERKDPHLENHNHHGVGKNRITVQFISISSLLARTSHVVQLRTVVSINPQSVPEISEHSNIGHRLFLILMVANPADVSVIL